MPGLDRRGRCMPIARQAAGMPRGAIPEDGSMEDLQFGSTRTLNPGDEEDQSEAAKIGKQGWRDQEQRVARMTIAAWRSDTGAVDRARPIPSWSKSWGPIMRAFA